MSAMAHNPNVMATREEIIEKIQAMQQSVAKRTVYNDVIDLVKRYEAKLKRQQSDALKKQERLAQRDKKSEAYLDAVNQASVLQSQIVSACELRIELTEQLIEMSKGHAEMGNELAEFAKQLEAEGK